MRVRVHGAAVIEPARSGNTTAFSRLQVADDIEVDAYQVGDAVLDAEAPGLGGGPLGGSAPTGAFVVPVGDGARVVLLVSDSPMVAFLTTSSGDSQSVPFDGEMVWSCDAAPATAVSVAGTGKLHFLTAA